MVKTSIALFMASKEQYTLAFMVSMAKKKWQNKVLNLCFSVDDGAIIDAVFDSFRHSPPSGFDRIMVEKALLWTTYSKMLLDRQSWLGNSQWSAENLFCFTANYWAHFLSEFCLNFRFLTKKIQKFYKIIFQWCQCNKTTSRLTTKKMDKRVWFCWPVAKMRSPFKNK